ncbi:50S ribosomal protein L21 [bacterium]|nr:50S ribosomal protein L21 [bacterium]
MELTMYAVFEDGSRQYMVSEGDVVNIDLRLEPIGNMLEITSVLLISNGADLKIGQPLVKGAKITVEIVGEADEKVRKLSLRSKPLQ